MRKDIQHYERIGAWVSFHGSYYEWTYKSYAEYRNILIKLESEEEKIKIANSDLTQEDLHSLISHETDELRNEAYRFATSAHLFASMTIEAFINHYGVKRLGESFYKRNVERIGITEKFSILFLACHGVILDKKNQILVTIREIFDKRNRLVHPKTKEINKNNFKDFINEHPKDLAVKKCIDDMEDVIDDFCRMDNSIRRDFEFSKPTME